MLVPVSQTAILFHKAYLESSCQNEFLLCLCYQSVVLISSFCPGQPAIIYFRFPPLRQECLFPRHHPGTSVRTPVDQVCAFFWMKYKSWAPRDQLVKMSFTFPSSVVTVSGIHLLSAHFHTALSCFSSDSCAPSSQTSALVPRETTFPFFSFCVFRAAPMAYGSSQARGQIRAAAASLYHSHSNARFEPHFHLYCSLQ